MYFFKLLLLPFSMLYGIITGIRNFSFNIGVQKSYIIPKKSICVGNLEVGGTGKTPHVSYLTELLYKKHSTTILSRGYGRKTKGYIEGTLKSISKEIGDEPKLYKNTFKDLVNVVVCEKRKIGVEIILKSNPKNEVIILDDAFQHRAVKAGLNILITDFEKPYYNNWMLPSGTLREWMIGRERADVVIVSKTPTKTEETTKKVILKKLKFNTKNIFFSSIVYGEIKSFNNKEFSAKNVLLVTGISNPSPLEKELKKSFNVELMKFPDHYNFTVEDIKRIHQKFDTFVKEDKVIVTTEKDFMRLGELIKKTNINDFPWFYQSISVKLDREKEFKALINTYVNTI